MSTLSDHPHPASSSQHSPSLIRSKISNYIPRPLKISVSSLSVIQSYAPQGSLRRISRTSSFGITRTSSFGGAPIIKLIIPHVETKHPGQRWVVLVLACLLLFGNYFAYDSPAALNVPLGKYLQVDYETWFYDHLIIGSMS
jgi:hypothetical protein